MMATVLSLKILFVLIHETLNRYRDLAQITRTGKPRDQCLWLRFNELPRLPVEFGEQKFGDIT